MIKQKPISEKAFRGYGIELRPMTPCDMRSLRQWRNSSEIRLNMLDTSIISPRQQRLWYEKVKGKTDQAHWVVWCKGIRTGYLNIKGGGHLESQEVVELGIYVGDSVVRHGLLGYAISLLGFDIAFEHLSVLLVQSWVKEDRYMVRKFDKQLGYQEGECVNGFVRLSINESGYKKAKAKLIRYFN